MILGDVEETITVVEYDEDTCEELVKVRRGRQRGRGAGSGLVDVWRVEEGLSCSLFLLLNTKAVIKVWPFIPPANALC